ncbi:MAG: hypothetical protein HYV63_11370 [Candidatus Schekmanbacteria bacterium]|nr:hypothetical protein [Candidatus Schekmanbacteria bacterium]
MAVLAIPPLLARKVAFAVAGAAPAAALRVHVDALPGAGGQIPVTPDGSPLKAKLTVSVKFVRVRFAVSRAEAPWFSVTAVGASAREYPERRH